MENTAFIAHVSLCLGKYIFGGFFMKKNRLLVLLTLFIVTVTSVFCFVACTDEKDATGTLTVVIATGDNPVEFNVDIADVEGENGLFSVLEYLRENKKITFKYSGTDSSAYLTEINDFVNGTDNKWIYIYTNVEKDFAVSKYKTEIEYKGQKLTSSGAGVSQMTIEEGALIYIGTIEF